jgi:N-acetylglucosaminyldiphosphoundecaprenol N-acetyl-beta-D-mannosaminyltransferase
LSAFIPVQVVTLTPEMCIRVIEDEAFGSIVQNAGIVVADGVGVVWGEGVLKGKRPEKIPGIELAQWALGEVDRLAGRVFLLGARPECAEKAAEAISRDFPRLTVSGWQDGYFDPSEESGIAERIASTQPHLVLVAMGSPKQESFIAGHLFDLKCAVAIGVGGAFDVWSGAVRRAPTVFRLTGTEWLFRTLTQPRARLNRIGLLARFVVMVLKRRRERGHPA